ncbi:MAG: type VI secretion protein, partial [Sphingomonas sp.]
VDVGLAQVNSANFARLGVTIEQVFDPCTNLRLASLILQDGYELASLHYSGLDAISATYSLYNTGTLTRGFRNGYVGRVWSAARDIGSMQATPRLPASMNKGATATPAKTSTAGDSWVIGQIASTTIEVFE